MRGIIRRHRYADPTRRSDFPLRVPGLQAWYDPLDPTANLQGDGSAAVDGAAIALRKDKSGNSNVNALVLSGVGGNWCRSTTGVAVGTNGFTISMKVRVPLADATAGVTALTDSTATTNRARALYIELRSEGALWINLTGATASDYIRLTVAAFTVGRLGQLGTLTMTRTGTTFAAYWTPDGGATVALSGAESAGGTSPTWAGSITSTYSFVGMNSTSSEVLNGNVFFRRLYNSVLGAGAIAADAAGTVQAGCLENIDFRTQNTLLVTGTFVCSTGQTVTVTSTGATGARIAGERDAFQGVLASRGLYNAAGRFILTDGVDDYWKTALFPLPQPVTMYNVIEQTTWTSGDYLFDGGASDTLALIQTTSTPQLNLSAGSSVAANTDLAVATKALVTIISNGASSLVQVNRFAPTTGNAGAGVPNGLTIASKGTAGSYANARYYEQLVYSGAHDQATRSRVALYLARKWGFAV